MATIVELFDQALRFHQTGDVARAEPLYHLILEMDSSHADARSNLGIIFGQDERFGEAVECFRQVVCANPEHVNAHYNLGSALVGLAQLDEAADCFRTTLRLDPGRADAYNNLGNVYKEQGQLDDALSCFARALAIKPDFITAHNNLIYTLHITPGLSPESILAECRNWDRQHAAPLARFIRTHDNDRTCERRLRIGYVSPDFRSHPVGRFILPLLRAHDRTQVEVFCYSSVRRPDAVTDRCQSLADVWRSITSLSDEQTAERIRDDRIDILVDLAMHTMDNRLLVFARKPAPIQVTYLAYGGTTGMNALDYRLTDAYLDPQGPNDAFYSEKLIRLPDTYWLYQPVIDMSPAPLPPASTSDGITFGCLNNFCKVTIPTLELWAELMQRMPHAKLLLYARAGSHRARVHDVFGVRGVSPDRVTFLDRTRVGDYFRSYDRIDVALDPFPCGGGTTTCDALWMGVPVVTLAGATAIGRGGLSILSNVGLGDLAAGTVVDYVRIASDLATDLRRLSELRANLRVRMSMSPLMDSPRFAHRVELAYRAMWLHWCELDSK